MERFGLSSYFMTASTHEMKIYSRRPILLRVLNFLHSSYLLFFVLRQQQYVADDMWNRNRRVSTAPRWHSIFIMNSSVVRRVPGEEEEQSNRKLKVHRSARGG